MAATIDKTVQGELVYKFEGLQYSNAIQSIYLGTTYVYTLQRVKVNGGNSVSNTVLTRFTRNDSTKIATRVNEMTLEGFGHSQTLQFFSHGGKDYWWITCKGMQTNSDKGDDTWWSTQLARVQYVPFGSVNYTQCTRLSYLNYANASGTSAGKTQRVEAALSSDKTKLLIMGIMLTSPRRAQFTEYDNEKLNNYLDTQEAMGVLNPKCTAAGVKATVNKGFYHESIYGYPAYQSIQGIEFANNEVIYIASGKKNYKTAITRGNWGLTSGKYTVSVTTTGNAAVEEVEGLMLSGDYVYMGLAKYTNTSDTSPSSNYLYRIAKSSFK